MPMLRPCSYCGGPFSASDESYAQNPYCSKCLNRRLQEAAALDPVIGWREVEDGYMVPVRRSDLKFNEEAFDGAS